MVSAAAAAAAAAVAAAAATAAAAPAAALVPSGRPPRAARKGGRGRRGEEVELEEALPSRAGGRGAGSKEIEQEEALPSRGRGRGAGSKRILEPSGAPTPEVDVSKKPCITDPRRDEDPDVVHTAPAPDSRGKEFSFGHARTIGSPVPTLNLDPAPAPAAEAPKAVPFSLTILPPPCDAAVSLQVAGAYPELPPPFFDGVVAAPTLSTTASVTPVTPSAPASCVPSGTIMPPSGASECDLSPPVPPTVLHDIPQATPPQCTTASDGEITSLNATVMASGAATTSIDALHDVTTSAFWSGITTSPTFLRQLLENDEANIMYQPDAPRTYLGSRVLVPEARENLVGHLGPIVRHGMRDVKDIAFQRASMGYAIGLTHNSLTSSDPMTCDIARDNARILMKSLMEKTTEAIEAARLQPEYKNREACLAQVCL